jgi:hypothetical protein
MSSKRARESPAPGELRKRPKVATTTLVYPSTFSKEDKDEVRGVNLQRPAVDGPAFLIVLACAHDAHPALRFVHYDVQPGASSAAGFTWVPAAVVHSTSRLLLLLLLLWVASCTSVL